MARLMSIAVFLSVLAAAPLASAATCTWTGVGTDNNWSTPANWDNCGGAHPVPINGDALVFPQGGVRFTATNDIVGLSLASLQVTGTTNSGSSYNIAGNGITLTTASGVLMSVPTAVLGGGPNFQVPITLGVPLSITNTGVDGAVVGPINLNGNTLTFNTSSADIWANSAISGTGAITKVGTKTLRLQSLFGTSTWVGTTQINAGAILVVPTSLGGTGTTIGSGGTLETPVGGPLTFTEPLTLSGGTLAVMSATLPGLAVWNGPITVTADSNISAGTPFNALPLTINGPISGTFTLHMSGILALNGASPSFIGSLSAEGTGGTLLVNGSLPNATVSAASGATVRGTGTVGTLLGAGGIIGTVVTANPPPDSGAGILNAGQVTLSSTSTFGFRLNGPTAGTGYNQLNVTGTVNLANATLNVSLGFTPPQTAVFTLIHSTNPIVGTFAGLPEGATIFGPNGFAISYVGGSGHDVTLANRTPANYFLSEGATGSFFTEDVLIANSNTLSAPVTFTYLTPTTSPIVRHANLPAQSRTTIHVNQIPGLEATEVSTQVTSDAGLPVTVERTMFWDATTYAGTTGSSVERPSQDWLFAEGSQGFFSTYVLLANPNPSVTNVTLTFLREAGPPVVKNVTVGPSQRFTVDLGTFSEIINQSFGIAVHATQPIIAERSMYFGSTPNRLWSGGTESSGVSSASTSWFLAEGATGSFFTTFILLGNPQNTTANVTVRFLLDTGDTITEAKMIPANGRLTINIGAEPDPRLRNAAVSTVVTSDVPIVVERSMYWIGDVVPWAEGHNSFGVTNAGTHWGLAEGRVGTPTNFHTYILLGNPQATAANVTVTFLRENGNAPIVQTYTVPPTSRFNIDVNAVSPNMHDETVAADVRVTNGVPIVVERSMYWDWRGLLFKAGTNATGLPLP
jgi:hypothetical protein